MCILFVCVCSTHAGLNIITDYIIGYLYPGLHLANVSFKMYGYMSMVQDVAFPHDFKLGHCMKIPPRSMFVVHPKILLRFSDIIALFVQ